ncbi:MAG: PAS domain S-box protein [Verrucomicrobiae bacterium]|nr:PAS domain S-box protein [Verrucomicrobiae bacterium]MDW8308959.1 PAS domain S-box protein [Verrucomicrobiales bacterium]
MSRYADWSREELLERLQALETGAPADVPSPEHIERRRAQAALRESEARLRAILQTAVEGIVTIDERGIIESFNPAAEKIFGYRAEEVVGKSVNLLMPEPHCHEHDRYIQNYLRTGQARIIGIGREVQGRRKDGTVFPMDLAVSEVRLDNRRLFTGFIRDITERKRLEREILEITDRERRRIGQELHDGLCQQLAGIELITEALARDLKKQGHAAAAQVERITEHLRHAIAEARRLARGLSPVSLESDGLAVALGQLATAVSQLFNLECRFQTGEPVRVRDNTVANHLYRIAQEAIHNAVRHGRARSVVVSLHRQGEQARLTVADNGTGFDRQQANGRGMGLQIMKYRAGMIGATLDVQSAPGRGTTVTCLFKPDA